MATNAVDICNTALILNGAQTINSLSDDSKAAKICNKEYDKIRKAVLTEHPWNFAMARKELAATVNTPVFKFSKEYLISSDVLRILSTNLDPSANQGTTGRQSTFVSSSDEWKVETNTDGNKVIVTDATTMKILYIKDIEDVGQFNPSFEEALAYRLASRISYALVQSTAKSQELFKLAEFFIARARSFDAQEGSMEIYEANDWLDVRL